MNGPAVLALGECPGRSRPYQCRLSAYAKSVVEHHARVAALVGGIAAPGQPLRDLPDSFHPDAILATGRRQAEYVNAEEGRYVAGGRLIAVFVQRGEAIVRDLSTI